MNVNLHQTALRNTIPHDDINFQHNSAPFSSIKSSATSETFSLFSAEQKRKVVVGGKKQ